MDEQIKQGLIYTMRLLAIARKSEKQIREKLKQKGYSAESSESVIQELKVKKILDDVGVAKEKVYWAIHGNPMGKRRVQFELQKKGIGKQVIAEALEGFNPEDERKAALDLAKTRAEKLTALAPIQRKKRLYDYLIRRGFGYDICGDVAAALAQNIENS